MRHWAPSLPLKYEKRPSSFHKPFIILVKINQNKRCFHPDNIQFTCHENTICIKLIPFNTTLQIMTNMCASLLLPLMHTTKAVIRSKIEDCSGRSTQVPFWRKWVIDGFEVFIGQKIFWQHFWPLPSRGHAEVKWGSKFQNASNDLSCISNYSWGYKDHKNI